MMEFTCIECGFKYDETCGDLDERTCNDCLEEELSIYAGGDNEQNR